MRTVRHRAYVLRSETIPFNRLCPSLPHNLISPNSAPVQSLTDKQLVPALEMSPSSVADNATEVQNPSTAPVYQVAPPSHPPIAGVRATERGITHNLMTDFVDVSNPEGFGVVMNLWELMAWVTSSD